MQTEGPYAVWVDNVEVAADFATVDEAEKHAKAIDAPKARIVIVGRTTSPLPYVPAGAPWSVRRVQ